MLAATTISSAISFYAFFVAIVLFVRSKQWRFSFFSLAALLATATMAAFNVALYFDWAPILRISFHGKDYEFTNIFLTGVALVSGAASYINSPVTASIASVVNTRLLVAVTLKANVRI